MPNFRGQGWCNGESTCLPPMWAGFNSQCWLHMWFEFVVGSLPCSKRFFSGYFGFPPSQKPTFPNSNFDQESGRRRTTKVPHPLSLSGCGTSKSFFYLFMFFFIYLFYLWLHWPSDMEHATNIILWLRIDRKIPYHTV